MHLPNSGQPSEERGHSLVKETLSHEQMKVSIKLCMQNHYGIALLNAGEDWSPEE